MLPRHLIAKRDTTAEPGVEPRPTVRQERLDGTTPSWRAWAEQSVVDSWKETCAEVVSARGFDFKSARDLPQVLYEFPDGYHQYFGEERYRFTEMYFDPKNYFDQSIEPPATLRAVASDHAHDLKTAVPLSQLVHDSIMACDVDVRAALLQNIVVVGNGSITRGLTERLDVELAALLPSVSVASLRNPPGITDNPPSKRSRSTRPPSRTSASTRRGSVARSSRPSARSTSSGSQRRSTRSTACRLSFSVSTIATDNDQIKLLTIAGCK
jgi:actin-related protein